MTVRAIIYLIPCFTANSNCGDSVFYFGLSQVLQSNLIFDDAMKHMMGLDIVDTEVIGSVLQEPHSSMFFQRRELELDFETTVFINHVRDYMTEDITTINTHLMAHLKASDHHSSYAPGKEPS